MSSGLSPPKPLRVCSDKQCSTLVDNVLSRQYVQVVCSNVLHVGLGHVGLLCNCLSVLCLPHLCPGKFLYVLNYVCDVFPGVFLFEFECDYFHALFFYVRCVDVTFLENVSISNLNLCNQIDL